VLHPRAQTRAQALAAMEASVSHLLFIGEHGRHESCCERPSSKVQLAQRTPMHLSLGSIEHPHKCASACRYVKRKGGCRDGTQCQHCHLCFWRRDREQEGAESVSDHPATESSTDLADREGMATVVSCGTIGHPYTCAPACRYIRRKMGCRNGAHCPNCHACLWTREACDRQHQQPPSQEAWQQIFKEPPAVQANPNYSSVSDNLFGDSTETLQELIRVLLDTKTATVKVAVV